MHLNYAGIASNVQISVHTTIERPLQYDQSNSSILCVSKSRYHHRQPLSLVHQNVTTRQITPESLPVATSSLRAQTIGSENTLISLLPPRAVLHLLRLLYCLEHLRYDPKSRCVLCQYHRDKRFNANCQKLRTHSSHQMHYRYVQSLIVLSFWNASRSDRF